MSHSHALRDQNAGWWPGTETRAFNVYSCTMEDRKCVSSPALFPGLPTVQYLVSNPSPTIPSAHIQYQCSHQNYRAQIISHDHSRPSVRDQTLKSIFNQTLRLYKVLKLSQKWCVIQSWTSSVHLTPESTQTYRCIVFMGFTSGGQELWSVFSAAVCKIQASKCYIKSLP